MRNQWCARAVTALLAGSLAGCVGFRGPVDVHREVRETTGVRYEREMGLTLAGPALALTQWAVDRYADEDVPDLSGLRKVQVGIYEARPEGRKPGRRLQAGDFPTWEPMVEVNGEDGEQAFVLVRREDEAIRMLLVVVDDTDELVIVRLKGHLDTILEDAVRFGLAEAERPELAPRVTQEIRRAETPEGGSGSDRTMLLIGNDVRRSEGSEAP